MDRFFGYRFRVVIRGTLGCLLIVPLSSCLLVAENSKLDLSDVPKHVALLAPTTGLTLDFGVVAVGDTHDVPLVMGNAGPAAATLFEDDPASAISPPFSFAGGTFPGTGGDCTANVGATSSCRLMLNYAPTTAGPSRQTLKLYYFDGVATIPIDVTLRADNPAFVESTTAAPADFGAVTVGATQALWVTLKNTGGHDTILLRADSAHPLTAPFAFAGGSYPGTSGTCGSTLAPADECQMSLTFNPGALGPASETLTLIYGDGLASQTFTLGVTGNGQ